MKKLNWGWILIIVMILSILSVSAETIVIKGGRKVMIDTDTLIATDSSKVFLELWGSWVTGDATFDFIVDSLTCASSPIWSLYSRYGNDTLHMCAFTLVDSGGTEIDTTYIHVSPLKATLYYEWICYFYGAVNDSITARLGSHLPPIRTHSGR